MYFKLTLDKSDRPDRSPIGQHQSTSKPTTANLPSLTTDKSLVGLYIDDNDSNEWTTVEPTDRINKKLMNLHTESPISIYLKLKQIRKQLMLNNTQHNQHKNDRNRNEILSTNSSDQNQDASNLLKLHETFTGGFSPLTFLPVHNKSHNPQSNQKDKYLNIINNTFKNQNVNIVTVSPIPPNHKPLPNTPVHISSMDFGQVIDFVLIFHLFRKRLFKSFINFISFLFLLFFSGDLYRL